MKAPMADPIRIQINISTRLIISTCASVASMATNIASAEYRLPRRASFVLPSIFIPTMKRMEANKYANCINIFITSSF
jgi:hypothetical protein